MRPRLMYLAFGAIIVLALSDATRAATHVVTIERMAFGPIPAELQPGDVIEWRNVDVVPHTATAKDGQFDVPLAPGEHVTTILSEAGRIEVYCIYHPGMRTVLVVGRNTAANR